MIVSPGIGLLQVAEFLLAKGRKVNPQITQIWSAAAWRRFYLDIAIKQLKFLIEKKSEES